MSEAAAKAQARRTRPKYLSLRALLFEIRLPLPGWISILHRISGALLFFPLVWLLYLLDSQPRVGGRFREDQHTLACWPVKLACWC